MKLRKYLRQYLLPVSMFFLITTLLLATYTCLSSNRTLAVQDEIPGKGLTLSPLRSELEIAPGTSLDGQIMVANSTDKLMAISFGAEEFSVINQQYDYAFAEDSDMTKWISFSPAQTDLMAGQNKLISFRVGVPLSAEPGGRYLSLFASTDVKTSDSGINSRQRVASLLYITVVGSVTRNGSLLSLTSPWAAGGESAWSMVLRNTGTTHFRSRYSAIIKNILDDSEAANVSGDTLILPGTVRSISDKLPLPQFPGIYKVVYTIGLGDKPSVVETRWLIYMPLWAIIIALVAIIFIILALFRKIKTKKR